MDASATAKTGAFPGLQQNEAPSFETAKLVFDLLLSYERVTSQLPNRNRSVCQKPQQIEPNNQR